MLKVLLRNKMTNLISNIPVIGKALAMAGKGIYLTYLIATFPLDIMMAPFYRIQHFLLSHPTIKPPPSLGKPACPIEDWQIQQFMQQSKRWLDANPDVKARLSSSPRKDEEDASKA